MFIRAYLRASTSEQDASRAEELLKTFVDERNLKIACTYKENISGNKLIRPELNRLINDALKNDILLIESVDRLTRLTKEDWDQLSTAIKSKGMKIVALDLPTSHQLLDGLNAEDEFTGRILDAINELLLDILAATANKDYTQRRERQRQGIEANRDKFKGKQPNRKLHSTIATLLTAGDSWAEINDKTGASRSTIARVAKKLKAA